MSKHLVTFVGQPCPAGKDPAHFKAADREVVSFGGVDFPKDQAVSVDFSSPKGRAALAKLKGNNHFKVEAVIEEGVPAKQASADDSPATDPNVPLPPPNKPAHPLDHDGDGKKGGSKKAKANAAE